MELATTALGLLGLNGKNGSGKPPETRLTTAQDARQLLGTLEQEDEPRSRQRAIVKGMVDGHPPYRDKKEGRGWECNLNFGEGMAIMNRTGVPYYNLFARVPTYATCCSAYQPDNPDAQNWDAAITRRFDELLKRWPEFNQSVQQASYWMRLHGIGFLMPENDFSWRIRPIETGAVKVPKYSPSSLGARIPFVFIDVPYRIVELWNFIKDEKTAKAKGWNVDAVKLAIKYGMRGQSGTDSWWATAWEHYERILKNHDQTASFSDGDIVDCSVMLLQEFAKPGDYQGKISKFIFTKFKTVSVDDFKKMPKGGDEQNDFLFADPNCYDSYLEGLIPFFRNTGDGTWHSVRGYAQEAFRHVSVSNRLKCQMINRAFIDSSVVIQHPTERNRKQMQLLTISGTVAQLPANTQILPTVIQGGTDGVIAVDRVLTNHLNGNIGASNPRSIAREDGKGEVPTKRQIDYTAANEAALGEGEITIFYQQLDELYNFMFNRAADPSTSDKEAKRFQKECKEDGVPREALKEMDYVRANRLNGYGSPEMGIMKMEQGLQIFPMLPEDGKQNFMEDYVTNHFGPQFTERYVPRQHIPDEQDWQADVENMMIAAGKVPEITAGQDDVIHLQRHFEDAQKTLAPAAQAMQQGEGQPQDPQALQQNATYASTMAQHAEAHIQRLSNDPSRKKEAKLFEDQFKQLAEFSQELWRALRQAHRQLQVEQQQQQQATALGALDQAKVESIQTQTQLGVQKTQAQIENQRAKTLQQMRLKDVTTAQKIGLDRITKHHDMQMDRVQVGHDIAMDKKKAQETPSDVGAE